MTQTRTTVYGASAEPLGKAIKRILMTALILRQRSSVPFTVCKQQTMKIYGGD